VFAESKRQGVWPMPHFNRLQITPPLNLTEDEAREGLAGIDAALAVADSYYEG
jgi:taurine---2-oxoglutarate transaminase